MGAVTAFDARPGSAPLQPGPGEDRLRCILVAEGEAAVVEHLRGWPMAQDGFGLHQVAPTTLDIVFGQTGNAARVLRGGWSAPEPGYTWTVGHRATLVLPRPVLADRFTLEIQLTPFVHPPGLAVQRLALEVNGVAAPMLAVSADAVLAVEIPGETLVSRPGVEVVLTMPDAARPATVTGRADDRVLGLCVRRLMLSPVGPSTGPRGGTSSPDRKIAAAWPAHGPGRSGDAHGLATDDLMMRFESLGENCEFGLVQRRCGAEPLGLLRFASAPLPNLLAALRAGFAGMGTPENVVVELSANAREYMVRDRAFAITYHAWVAVGEQTPEAIHKREVRRIPLLVRKMIEDLQAGEKVFVYHAMTPLSPSAALALTDAVRAYGPGVVLWVELADAEHPAGSAEWVADGLLKGFVDRFAPGENAHDLSIDSWISLSMTVNCHLRGRNEFRVVVPV